MYSGEEGGRPAPFFCSFTLVSCPLLPLLFFFYPHNSLSPSFLDSPSLVLFWSLSAFSPHRGIIPPTLFRQSWAQCLDYPDSTQKKQQPIHLPAPSLPLKEEEQRSSFITIVINNANSAAVAAGESGEPEVAGTGTTRARLSVVEAGAWKGLSPGRVGDCRDPIGLRDRQRSKACCQGVEQALGVSGACKEILISFFFCLWSDSM